MRLRLRLRQSARSAQSAQSARSVRSLRSAWSAWSALSARSARPAHPARPADTVGVASVVGGIGVVGAVDHYVNRLLRRRRPRPFAPTEDDLAIVRTAIDLLAAAPDATEPRPAFVDQLRTRLAEQEQADQAAAEAPRPAWRVPARRRFLAAGALTATGAAIGVAADRLVITGRAGTGGPPTSPEAELTPAYGTWHTVADSSALPEGAVLSFDLGAVNGFLRRVSGRAQAVSGVCTHQGCRLDLEPSRDQLSCPCHGATFTLAGANLTHPLHSGQALPPLPRLPVREQSGQIQIYAPRSE